MQDSIWGYLVQVLILALSNVLTFFLTRKKYNSEVEGNDIDNLRKTIGLYKEVIDDLEVRLTRLNKRLQELEGTIEELKNENKDLKENLCGFPKDCKFLEEINKAKNN